MGIGVLVWVGLGALLVGRSVVVVRLRGGRGVYGRRRRDLGGALVGGAVVGGWCAGGRVVLLRHFEELIEETRELETT